jgi:hypothetical protein
VSPGNYEVPRPPAARIRAWQAHLDTRKSLGERRHEDFEFEASDAEGVKIAREVKLFLGEDYYVEFRPIREIAIRAGGAVELEVPRFVTGLAR